MSAADRVVTAIIGTALAAWIFVAPDAQLIPAAAAGWMLSLAFFGGDR